MSETNQGRLTRAIGLMSGTSLDGVDAALLETDGEQAVRPGRAITLFYSPEIRALLRAALEAARDHRTGLPVPSPIREAEQALTEAHIQAVGQLLQKAGLRAVDIAYLGFHGQTVLHRPDQRRTWQIGNCAHLAQATGIATVGDFRLADVAAGGQGAPLVPLYHAALCARLTKPLAVVNIGGVANATFLDSDGALLAFDTGPGNAAIDDWAMTHTGKPVDENGALAAQGRVHEAQLMEWLAHPFFQKSPPKSLDRLDFGMTRVQGYSPSDGAATLTAFTAASVTASLPYLPRVPRQWIICGGGRHNPVLMRELQARLPGVVLRAEDVGWRGDFLEAEAFAYLAVRSVKGLPLSLPPTTGVPAPLCGGRLYRP